MQSTAARAFLVSFGILVLTGLGCKQTKSCAPNTVFVSLTFSGAALNADTLTMVTCLADACRPAESVQHTSGKSTGTVELTFTTYTPGTTFKVTVTPMKGTDALTLPVSQSVVLASECTIMPISVGSNTDAGLQTGPDGASGDRAGGTGGVGGNGFGSGGSGGSAGSNSGGADGQAGGRSGGAGSEGIAPGGQPGGVGGQPGGTGGQPALCSESATRTCAMDGLMGNCAKGTETCVGGKWGACSLSPQGADSCSAAGDDANCNGAVNEGCACIGTATRSCALDGFVGNCAKGTETCAGGKWGACSVAKKSSDSCSVTGDDANCDGTPNEGCTCVTGATQPCGPQIAQGICKQGTQTCTANAWGACQGAVYAALRSCASALDNDCDGRPDNTIDAVCQCTIGKAAACGAHAGYDGKGPCKAGTQACVAGANGATSALGACTGAVGPATSDTCDSGNDANCNGVAGDNPPCKCINGQTQKCGNCSGGTQTCAGGTWGACQNQPVLITYYPDVDGDGYGDSDLSKSMQSCSGAPAGWLTSSTDCCDTDAGSHPGTPSSAWFTYANKCGSYDWNCDKTVELSYTRVQASCPEAVFNGDGWTGPTVPACGVSAPVAHQAPPCDEACQCAIDDRTQSCR